MDRRIKSRIDVQLRCRVREDLVVSDKSYALTENISRNGLLLHWTRRAPVPEIGTSLRVEVELPSEGIVTPRMILCESVVVRHTSDAEGRTLIGLRVKSMKFADDGMRDWLPGAVAATSPSIDVSVQ